MHQGVTPCVFKPVATYAASNCSISLARCVGRCVRTPFGMCVSNRSSMRILLTPLY